MALPTAQKIAWLSYLYLSEIVEGSQLHQGSFFLGGLSRVPLSFFEPLLSMGENFTAFNNVFGAPPELLKSC